MGDKGAEGVGKEVITAMAWTLNWGRRKNKDMRESRNRERKEEQGIKGPGGWVKKLRSWGCLCK